MDIKSLWDADFKKGVCGERFRILNELQDYNLFYVVIGSNVRKHKHERRDERCFVVDGEGILEVEKSRELYVKKGDLFEIPRGTFHSLERASGVPLAIIVVSSLEYDVSDVVYPKEK